MGSSVRAVKVDLPNLSKSDTFDTSQSIGQGSKGKPVLQESPGLSSIGNAIAKSTIVSTSAEIEETRNPGRLFKGVKSPHNEDSEFKLLQNSIAETSPLQETERHNITYHNQYINVYNKIS